MDSEASGNGFHVVVMTQLVSLEPPRNNLLHVHVERKRDGSSIPLQLEVSSLHESHATTHVIEQNFSLACSRWRRGISFVR